MYHFLLVTYHFIVKKIKLEDNSFFGFYCDFSINDLFGHVYESDNLIYKIFVKIGPQGLENLYGESEKNGSKMFADFKWLLYFPDGPDL
jgi:hypothetical protein